jgi:hypothetical protein
VKYQLLYLTPIARIKGIFIAVYPVGIPAFFITLLYLNRHTLGAHATGGQNSDAWWYGDRDTLHFLVNGYRPATFWFEQVDFLRKLLMAGGVIFDQIKTQELV